MAYDEKLHRLDDHGFIVDRHTGQRVGLEQTRSESPRDVEFPKWVKVHDSQIVRQNAQGGEHISTPRWPQYVIDRVTQEVRVLVANVEEEAEALRDIVAPKKNDDDE